MSRGRVSPSVASGVSLSGLRSRPLLPLVGRYQCHACHHQTSLTGGTVFASTKLLLTTWFLAIYLLTQSKNAMSALELKRQLGVSDNTAWLLKHKILHVMKDLDDSALWTASFRSMMPTGAGREGSESGDGALPARHRSWRPSPAPRTVVPSAFV